MAENLKMELPELRKHPYPEHMQIARQIAAEGMVLLKNEENILPLTNEKIALFGGGAEETITCGTGSGFITAPYVVSVRQGLEDAGIEITSKMWLERFAAASKKANEEDKTLTFIDRVWSGISILIDDLTITDEELREASKETDTAVYVIRRNAGEGGDRKAIKGDYYLSDAEERNLKLLSEMFSHVVVVLNTCVIDAAFLEEIPHLDAAVLMGLSGNECGHALADILTGKINPSGRLTDTWARQYSDNPASAMFGENDGNSLQEDYTEDIFVGYRYFDAFGIRPMFPFGYGLSYTEFTHENVKVAADWEQITIRADVRNIGKRSGREVVQVYVTAPEGKLTKPMQELKAFAKTKEIEPGTYETVTMTFPTETLGSYDEALGAFVMEPGVYLIRIGKDSRNTNVAGMIELDETAVVRKVQNALAPDHELETLQAPKRAEDETEVCLSDIEKICLNAIECITKCQMSGEEKKWDLKPQNELLQNETETNEGAISAEEATLVDVKDGRISMKAFVQSLDDEVLLRLVTGHANETPYEVPKRGNRKFYPVDGPGSSGATTSLFVDSLGIPNWLLTDGPAGLHLIRCEATSCPTGIVLAQTWDESAIEKIGEIIGKELEAYHYSVILGPGLNIHRDPLCGRNFEYYSEDPLLSGKMAAGYTRGVQKTPGAAVSVKHFACNNQEADRTTMNATVSERALREIYLRGFEICVRESNPKTVMTSYNLLNGVHTSSRKDLLTDILRGEWGFQGLVMTDWGTTSVKTDDLIAGNDLIMGGYRTLPLLAAMRGTEPEFAEDGYVLCEEFDVFGGFMKETVEHWNTFVPDAEGTDTVNCIVSADVEINEKAKVMIEKGVAEVEEREDGSRRILYHGKNQGAFLSRETVELCAARVLEQLMHSVSYEVMMRESSDC